MGIRSDESFAMPISDRIKSLLILLSKDHQVDQGLDGQNPSTVKLPLMLNLLLSNV